MKVHRIAIGERQQLRKLAVIGAVTLAASVAFGLFTDRAEAVQACGSSNGISFCVSVPSGQLSGSVPIAVTVSGSTSAIREMIFQWGPTTTSTAHLLTDFASPYGFSWRTDAYLDATQFLNVRIKRFDDSIGAPVSLQLTLENGNDTSVPANPADWAQLFEPRPFAGDPVIAAVGDGGDGTVRSDEVAASIVSSEASIVVYLGDLYERATPAELDENWGRAAFEPGGGSAWGALTRFTRPTVGNHEIQNIAAWRNYWHGRPDWETFVFGGTRFLNLNSECTQVGGCAPGSPQYAFVQSVLASNSHACVVAYWHRPVLSSVDDNTAMRPIWALLANNGGDLVLNGHTHAMEAYAPLNASLQAGTPDAHMVELISGAGGHHLTSTKDSDPRGAWQVTKVAGALYITAVGGGDGAARELRWEFRDRTGQVVNEVRGPGTGSVQCGGIDPDTSPPSIPAKPSGSSNSSGTIDLTWTASTDDRATAITYAVYRDGAADPVADVTSSSTTTVSFRDSGLTPGSTHTYEVTASDGDNTSGRSPPSDPISVQSSTVVFSDDFSTGTFSRWTAVAGLTIDGTSGSAAPPSARAQASASRAWASKVLGSTHTALCQQMRVNLSSRGTAGVVLGWLRAAADGPVARVYVNASGILTLRSDVSGAQLSSGRTLPSGWNTLELCANVGTAGSLRLSLNGATIAGPWTVDLGTTPIGRIRIGDTALATWTGNFDDVVVTA